MRPLLLLLLPAFLCAQSPSPSLYALYHQKQFHELHRQNSDPQRPDYQLYRAIWANVCNQPAASNRHLDTFATQGIADSLRFLYWKLRNDNAVKCFDYPQAFATTDSMYVQGYAQMSKTAIRNLVQLRRIWYVLRHEKPQTVLDFTPTVIPIAKDIAGLTNIEVQCQGQREWFVLDTGAGISCLSETTAKRLGARIYPDKGIKIQSFNGIENAVKIGVLPRLELGGVVIENALFLIFKDKDFAFDGGYQINGIIGFPIAKDLGTLTLTPDSLRLDRSPIADHPTDKNLFIHFFEPIVLLQFSGKTLPFSFDTGAARTLFYQQFWLDHAEDLDGKEARYVWRESSSAGGTVRHKVLEVSDLEFSLGSQRIHFPSAEIEIERPSIWGGGVYGNLGQDMLSGYTELEMSFIGNYLRLH